MSNTVITPENITAVAASLVGQDLGLAGLIRRDLENEFGGGSGSTVRVRVPGAVPARTRGTHSLAQLDSDSIVEQSVPVKLTTEAYSFVPLSDGDLSLDLKDYAIQVLNPQTMAIVKYVERTVVEAMQATPETVLAYDPAVPAQTFTAIRKTLRERGVGPDVRIFAAVGANIYAHLLDAEVLTAESIDDGVVKTVRGITVVESTRLAADEIVAFVPNAFTLVVRAPVVPDGAPYGASVKTEGFALRMIRAYNTSIAADTSLVTAFVGVSALPLAVDNEDGTVTLTPHAGAIRINTAA